MEFKEKRYQQLNLTKVILMQTKYNNYCDRNISTLRWESNMPVVGESLWLCGYIIYLARGVLLWLLLLNQLHVQKCFYKRISCLAFRFLLLHRYVTYDKREIDELLRRKIKSFKKIFKLFKDKCHHMRKDWW